VNVLVSEILIDGEEVNTLAFGQTVTINQRDVVLTGTLANGDPFSFDLNDSAPSFLDHFVHRNATLTVTLVELVVLGDSDQNGAVNFQDILPFIGFLTSDMYLEQADCNQDGFVNFSDIGPFISILIAGSSPDPALHCEPTY